MISYIFIVILVFLSALFSGSEISFASASEIKLRKELEKNRNIINESSYYIYKHYDKALITVLIGNNLVNIASSSIATVIAINIMGEKGASIATIIMTVFIIIFGEITPKIIASNNPESFARIVAIPVRFLMKVTYPIVVLVNAFVKRVSKIWRKDKSKKEVTEDDLETIIDTVEEEGVIDGDTADLLQNALDFDDVLAYEVITPRVDIQGIDLEDDEKKNIDIIMNTEYSRLPVYEGTLDDPKGYIVVDEVLKAIIKNKKDLKELIRNPIFVYKTMPLDDVLDTMRKENCHLVFVTDEYGGTMGIITMEDVVEQIVGAIWDEDETVEEDFEKIRKDTYDVQGDMRIEDMFEELDFEDKDFKSDNATVGGWATEMLKGYPKVGDSFEYKNLHFVIKEMDGMRVKEIRVKVNDKENS